MHNVTTVAGVKSLLDRAADANQVLLLDFTAKWCGPCKAMKPSIVHVEEAFAPQLLVAAVDVDAAEVELTDHFQVKSIPLLVFIRGGEVVHVIKGKHDKDQLHATVQTVVGTTRT